MNENKKMNQKNSGNGLWAGIVIIAIVIAGFFGIKFFSKKNNDTKSQTNSPSPDTNTPNTPTSDKTNSATTQKSNQYKDGIYSANGNYTSPGGSESIGVTLTIRSDIVVDSTVTSQAFRDNSQEYQNIFISNYKKLVVGKKLSELSLNKVSGSSLTPKGFNDAVSKIKTQAGI